MKLKKEQKKLLIGIGVIAVLAMVFIPGFFDSLRSTVFGTVNYCDETPFDGKCICQNGEQKVLANTIPMSYRCDPVIQLPAIYSFPLKTWEEALAFADNEMGGISCSDDQFYKEGYQLGALPDLYTIPSEKLVILSIDCSIAVGPNAGQSTWRLQLDPFDGHVYQRWCNQSLVNESMVCPVDIPFTPK